MRFFIERRRPGWLRALAAAALVLTSGCTVDLDERLVPCPGNELVESAHSWGSMIALRPTAGHDWRDLVREPFRQYGSPPITMQELEQRYGAPLRTWEDEGRPFAEFTLEDGVLRFGLEQDKSGSDVHRAWRLRWQSQSVELSQILQEPAVACASELLRPGVAIVILGPDSNIPRVSIHFDDDEIRDVLWPIPTPMTEADS